MSWVFSAVGIGTVTFPVYAIDKVSESNPARVTTFDPDGGVSDVFGLGKGVRSLTIGGAIHVSGQTNANLETNYLSPLRNFNGTIITVSSPDNQYNGSWLVTQFDAERTLDAQAAYYFTIKLAIGGTVIVI